MISRRWIKVFAALGLGLALVGARGARGQFGGYSSFGQYGVGYSSLGQVGTNLGAGVGYGGISFGGGPPSGYGIISGQVGSVYQSTGNLYRQAYRVARPQTTVALQPLYSAITSLPGWSGTSGGGYRRVRHVRPRSLDPPIPHYDRNGNILWPGIIQDDPTSTALRREANEAFRAAFRESKSTGHASIRPVIAAKNKLSAYERKILPAIKGRSVPDGDALEAFFVDLDRSLDVMNSYY